MGYRGSQEWLIWGEIPSEAILHTLSFAALLALVNKAVNVGSLLRLDSIDPVSNIARIRSNLQAEPVTLTTRFGAAIGRVASLFAFNPSSNPRHVAEFVAHLLQGWSIHLDPAVCTKPEVCQAFITALEFSTESGAPLPDDWENMMESAFTEGVGTALTWMQQEAQLGRTPGSASRSRSHRKRGVNS